METRAVVVDGVLRPEPAEERKYLVEPGRALLAGDTEGRLLVGCDDAEPKGGKDAPTREHVEGRPRLREQRGIAPGEHLHARAELQPGAAAGRDREADDRIGRRRTDPLGEPQRVEPVV